uniref:Uncharacterized protein n=1 Tax=Populus trichocarpa TaxID=3694 RepID=A0A2K1YUE0_POPTR
MAVETEVATVPELALALADSDNNRARQSFILLVLSSLIIIQQGLLHPTAVVKTRMQAADSGLSHMLRNDGIPAFPDGVLSLTAFEVSKDMILKYTEGLDMPEATRVSIANGVAGMLSNLVSCVYHVLLDVMDNYGAGRPSVLKATKTLLEEDGRWGFNRGFGSCFLNMSLYAWNYHDFYQ